MQVSQPRFYHLRSLRPSSLGGCTLAYPGAAHGPRQNVCTRHRPVHTPQNPWSPHAHLSWTCALARAHLLRFLLFATASHAPQTLSSALPWPRPKPRTLLHCATASQLHCATASHLHCATAFTHRHPELCRCPRLRSDPAGLQRYSQQRTCPVPDGLRSHA
jgi:hypothetical protein